MPNEKKKLATINIKGKEYVTVAQRVLHFNDTYPDGRIVTEITYEGEVVRCKATITPDIEKSNRYFTAHSEEVRGGEGVNKTSAVENAETSAVGRALGLMGIGVIEGIASMDEINKAKTREFVLSTQPNNQPKCAKCGSPTSISTKTGKPYCAAKCWLKEPPAPKRDDDLGLESLEQPF